MSKSVARAWIKAKYVKRFEASSSRPAQSDDPLGPPSRTAVLASVAESSASTKKRLEEAEEEARASLEMPLRARRDKYCFLNRYKGKWGLPWDLDLRTEEESNETTEEDKVSEETDEVEKASGQDP